MKHRAFNSLAAPTLVLSLLLLSACSTAPPQTTRAPENNQRHEQAQDVVLYALSLIDIDYRFGGRNPEAGLDCSGMVSYVFAQAVGKKLIGSAADIARQGQAIAIADIRPGDLVFFNTRNKAYSHVGIYIGDDRFAHAPSSGGKVRLDSLKNGWYASRFEAARSYF